MEKKLVSLQYCQNYDELFVGSRIENILTTINFINPEQGSRILLKPNFVSGAAPIYGLTDSLFIKAVAEYFLKVGCEVMVGDSPAFGSAKSISEKVGVKKVLRDLPVKIIDFNKSKRITLDCGVEVKVAQAVLDCDLFVNLPKLKAHGQFGVSFAVKNCFGVVCGMQKGMLHMSHGNDRTMFNNILLDIQKILPKQLVLADGIDVMHKSGPIKGEKLNLSCLGASDDSLLFDYYMLKMLGLEYKKYGLGNCLPRGELVSGNHQWLKESNFIVPKQFKNIRFEIFQFVKSVIKRLTNR
ncbi:MAG: DUF362 domain-containing protein [Desulfotalea sp.]